MLKSVCNSNCRTTWKGKQISW